MAANSEGTASISRRGLGRPFPRGTSGNPIGRPKVVFEIRDLAREFGPAGIAKLAEMAGLAPGIPAEAKPSASPLSRNCSIVVSAKPRCRYQATSRRRQSASPSTGPMLSRNKNPSRTMRRLRPGRPGFTVRRR